MFDLLLMALGLGFSSAATPGSYQAYLLSQTGRYGLRRSLPLSLVPLVSDGPIILLIMLVLTHTPDWLTIGLRLAGGFFLLYLAWGAFLVIKNPPPNESEDSKRMQGGFIKGVIMNLLNPNPYLFWSMIGGPMLITCWNESPVWLFLFVLCFYLTLIGGNAVLVLIFSLAHRLDRRLVVGLNILAALALLLIGLTQIYSGLNTVFSMIFPTKVT